MHIATSVWRSFSSRHKRCDGCVQPAVLRDSLLDPVARWAHSIRVTNLPRTLRLLLRATTFALLALLLLGACRDKEKMAAEKAGPILERLMPLLERDTKQVREGLPEGAAVLSKLLDNDPGSDPTGLLRALKKARAAVKKLEFAKSTFFAFVGPKGTVLRTNADTDLAAGQSLLKDVPDSKKMLDAKAGLVEVFGYLHGFRGVQKGGDEQWIVGHPVASKEGKLLGVFVSGWALRLYAKYLQGDTRVHLEAQAKDKTKPIPLVYVFIARGDKAWGAPVTPDSNAQAVAKLDLQSKTKTGTYQSSVKLEGRTFAVAARAAPKLGDGVVIAVLVSEF